MFASVTRRSAWTMGLAGLALVFTAGSPARADHIDKELFKKAGVIMKDLETHNYKNVGVLKFQVKKGSAAPSMMMGKLNSIMATRLENALIYYDNDKNPIGITRGASVVAASKEKTASYLTPEGRQGLFRNKYPLAWGTTNVDVDAFLTGLVDISPDLKTTKITIKAFDRKNLDLRKVLEFTVETDVAILRDTNMNFMVAKRSFNEVAKSEDPDETLNKIAVQNSTQTNQQGTKKLGMDQAREFLDVTILFDDQPVEINGEGFITKPGAGQKVKIKLKAKQKLGLLLRVNGMNTIDEQTQETADLNDYRWWILDPGTEYTIRGFYKDGNVKLFEAKAKDTVLPTELGVNSERHGKIDFDIFVDETQVAQASEPKTRRFNFRTVNTRAANFDIVKNQVKKSSVLASARKATTGRTFIVGGEVQQQQLETTTFTGRHVGGFTVNYTAPTTDTTGGGNQEGGN